MGKIWDRRDFLQMGGIAGTMLLIGEPMNADEKLNTAVQAADHLLLAIHDLNQGMDWAEKTFGIKAVIGGSHPGGGTRNALLSLGGKRYLEIIAPDPEQKTYTFPIDVRAIKTPQLIMWAASTSNIQSVAEKARDAGLQLMGPFDGSRARPDGKILKWKTAFVQHQFRNGNIDPIPFLIEWAPDSIHPSQDSPQGCTLDAFEIEHPQAENVRKMLSKLGLDVKVTQAANAKLIAAIKTAKGDLKLS
jgi:hypothetical protein